MVYLIQTKYSKWSVTFALNHAIQPNALQDAQVSFTTLACKSGSKISDVPHLPHTLSRILSCVPLENHAACRLGRKDAAALSRRMSRMFEQQNYRSQSHVPRLHKVRTYSR